jgi:hypothetical protein
MAKPTAQQLLAQLKQTQEDAEAFKDLWRDYFPPELSLPPDFEIRNAVRRLALSDLIEGMQSYLVVISKGNANSTSQKAMKYICGAAWAIKEKENPDQGFQPTARRIRNADKKVQ